MHGFQHIPTYSTCQSSPTARICPKMGYPLNPWNPMVYHHFSTSRLLFWGMSQWATPLDHCSTLFLAPEDTVISTPPSFSSTKSDRRSQLGLLDPKKKKHTQMAMGQYLLIPFLVGWTSIYKLFWCSPGVQGFDTLPNSIKLKLCAWPPLSSLNRFKCIILPVTGIPPMVVEDRLVLLIIEPQTKMGHCVTGRVFVQNHEPN